MEAGWRDKAGVLSKPTGSCVCVCVCVISYVHIFWGQYNVYMYPERFVWVCIVKNICISVCMFVIGLWFAVHTSVDMWTEISLSYLYWRDCNTVCVRVWSSGVWSIPSGVWRGAGQHLCSVFLLPRAIQSRSCVWTLQMSCYSLDLKVHTPVTILLALSLTGYVT